MNYLRFLMALTIILIVQADAYSARDPLQAKGWVLWIIPEKVDKSLGRATLSSIESQIKLLQDERVQNYVQKLGAELVSQLPRQAYTYRFAVLRDENINAFALPGGFIFVNSGLLQAAADEDELAGVIGHEIGHVVLRHSTALVAKMFGINSLLMLAQLSAAIVWPNSYNYSSAIWDLAHDIGVTIIQSKFSRDNERGADYFSVYLTSRAGYDPVALARFFEKLPQMPHPILLSTHPANEERMQRVVREATSLTWKLQPHHKASGELPEIKDLIERQN